MIKATEYLKDMIADDWGGGDIIGLPDTVFTLDEFDPNNPAMQVCFSEAGETKTYKMGKIHKAVQDVLITVYNKLTQYNTIDKDNYFKVRNEIDRTLTLRHNDFDYIQEVRMNGWKDIQSARGFGTKNRLEPIILTSSQVVNCINFYRGYEYNKTLFEFKFTYDVTEPEPFLTLTGSIA